MTNKHIIKLNTINKAKNFSDDLKTIDESIDIDISIGRYIIDARSIMGIFSLNLSEDILCVIHTDDENELSKFKFICNKYISEE